MKNNTSTEKRIYQEIDEQVDELKKMIDERYQNATMAEMEISIFNHLQGIGKTALTDYYKKKTLNLRR